LLAHLRVDDPERAALQSRAAAYSRDCGCAMGAAFVVGALLLSLSYFTLVAAPSFRTVIVGVVFVLAAALSGKAVGLLLAALKLALLRRSISRKLRAEGCYDDVLVH
jgi:nitrate reductase gamma subunit